MAGSFVWLERVPRAHRASKGEPKNGGEKNTARRGRQRDDDGDIVILRVSRRSAPCTKRREVATALAGSFVWLDPVCRVAIGDI